MSLDFDWDNASFATPDEAYEAYRAYSNIRGFCVRKDYEKKGNGDDNQKKYLRYCCNKEGFRLISKDTCKNARITDETRTGCKAFIYIRWVANESVYKVVSFHDSHNHKLHNPKHNIFFCDKKVDIPHCSIGALHQDTGISLKSSNDVIQSGVGESDKVDHRNLDKRHSKLKIGEASALIRHFSKIATRNPFFYYDFDFDEEEKIMNVFWADARMRMDYSLFGDCVTFDTTYRTNTRLLPLVVFVGFNHHRQSCVFGAALLYDETMPSFQWLFRSFLECMDGKYPKTIYTDFTAAKAAAIADVLPETYHALCSLHALENAKRHLGYCWNNRMGDMFNCLLYDVVNEEEFEEQWAELVKEFFSNDENNWMCNTFYPNRKKISSAWLRHQFTAGMRSEQLSEPLFSCLKRYRRKEEDNIVQFFTNFDRAMENCRVEEGRQDFYAQEKFTSSPYSIDPVLKHAEEFYTPNMFAELLGHYKASFQLILNPRPAIDSSKVTSYEVYNREGGSKKRKTFIVVIDLDGSYIGCSCQTFENWGLLCSHALRVISIVGATGGLHFNTIPPRYLLTRWSRNAKRNLDGVIGSAEHRVYDESPNEAYRKLCSMFLCVSMVVCKEKKLFEELMEKLRDLAKKSSDYGDTRSLAEESPNCDDSCSGGIGENVSVKQQNNLVGKEETSKAAKVKKRKTLEKSQ